MAQLIYEEPCKEDVETIEEQIGRRPRGLRGIVVRCPKGQPRVIVNKGIDLAGDRQRKEQARVVIFPTLFWLTCPGLVKIVSRIEDRGGVRQLQGRLDREGLGGEMAQAHQSYAALRWELLDEEERKYLQGHPKLAGVLKESGIGGIRGAGIKCLHTHLADYLARKANPAGRLVWQQIEPEQIEEQCILCADRNSGGKADV
ncbi:MAG: DUF501 domain-containing protein [Halanaerobium sp.]|nr:DUF501 domain-containing protein [Halanaerobium sp.]